MSCERTVGSYGMTVSRRKFLSLSGLAVGSLALRGQLDAATHRPPRAGLQLYTVRHALRSDLEGTLAKVASIGYREVELAGYLRRTAPELRDILRRAGLAASATHVPFESIGSGWEGVLEDASTLGCKYVVIPSIPESERQTLDDYRRVAERFNSAAEAASEAGLKFAYHNHDFEFEPLERRLPYDVLLEATDPERVLIEMDLYWVIRSGQDPLRYFERWPGRIKLLHLKDSQGAREHRMASVGAGSIDWPSILARAPAAGVEHQFVEHDDAANPLASIAASLFYLSDLQLAPVPPGPTRLRQSVARWTMRGIPLNELCKRARGIGLQAIDLLYPDEWPVVAEAGMACSMGYAARRPGSDFIEKGFNDPANHPMLLAELEAAIPLAARAQVPNLIAMFGNRNGGDSARSVSACVAGLSRIAPLAEEYGVTICLELLNSKIDHAGYEGDGTAFGLDVVQTVGSPRVRLLYDIYHMQIMEGDVIRTLRESIPWIAHFHTGGVPGRREIDASQELNYRAIALAIKTLGFRGYVAHEFVPAHDPLTSLAEAYQIFDV